MAVHQKSRLHQKFTSGCSGYRTREGSRLTRTLSTKSAIPKSNNDTSSRLYTVAVATSTTRGTYGEGGVNTSPNSPTIKSTPRRQSTTTARVPHQRRLGRERQTQLARLSEEAVWTIHFLGWDFLP